MSSSSQKGSASSSSSILGSLRAAREWATPTLKTSAFLERGVITPEEFVKAGDELVYRCPTWEWATCATKYQKAYLPANKQYLVTRNVPSAKRVAELEQHVQEVENEEDWLVSTLIDEDTRQALLEDEFDILDEQGEVIPRQQESLSPGGGGENTASAEDDEYADLETYEDDDVLVDDAAATADARKDGTDDNIVKVRTYDLSITYDKYYQTPRVWMVGTYLGQPLTASQMMEDVYLDYAQKTVTMERHPHIPDCPHASIHPCQHSKVMKTIVRNLISASDEQASQKDAAVEEAGTDAPSVEMYLFIFLKFISSMIPTINYDFTMDVTANVVKKK